MGTCLNCNQPIKIEINVAGRPKKYCNDNCRSQYNTRKRKPKERNCKHCNTIITEKGKHFCSDECRKKVQYEKNNARRRKAEKEIFNRHCPVCNTPFETERKTKVSCNESCAGKLKRIKAKDEKRYEFICKHCEKPAAHYDKRYTTFCSRECSFAYVKKNKMKRFCKSCDIELETKRAYCTTCFDRIKQEQTERRKLIAEWNARQLLLKRKENEQLKKEREEYRVKRLKERTNRISRRNFKSNLSLERLYLKGKGICYLCGIKCNWDDFSYNGGRVTGPTYPTREHVIALANGGTDTWDNVLLACFKCNTEKGTLLLEEYKYLKRLEVKRNGTT